MVNRDLRGEHRVALQKRFIIFYWQKLVAVALLGGALAFSVTFISALKSSAEHAIIDSLRADFGQRSYALQTGDPAATSALADLPGIAGVQDSQANISSGILASDVLLRQTADTDIELGVLVEGTRPTSPGEGLLDQATAQALQLDIGDVASVDAGGMPLELKIVGLTVDPADTSNRSAIQLVSESPTFLPSRWLSDRDFYDNPSLQPFLDRRVATYQSIDSLLTAAVENRPQYLASMELLPLGVGLVFGVLAVSAVLVLMRGWKRDVSSLVALGATSKQMWSRLLAVLIGVFVVGEFLGAVGALLLLQAIRGRVSDWFGQEWSIVGIPVATLVTLFAVTGVVSISSIIVLGRVPALQRVAKTGPWSRMRLGSRSTFWVAVVALAGAVIVAVVDYSRGIGSGDTGLLIPLSVVAVALVPVLISRVLTWGQQTATAIVTKRMLASFSVVAAVGSVVAFSATAWSLQTMVDADQSEMLSNPLQPAGSFVASAVPNSAIDAVANLYAERGGQEFDSYVIPDETDADFRSTSPSLVDCIVESGQGNPSNLPEDCFPKETAAPINTILIGPPGSLARADPGLIEDGKVGIIVFAANSPSAAQLADTSAVADAQLGGNLPGLVLPADSPVLETLGIVESGRSQLILDGFNQLQPADQVFMRASLFRLAPGSEISDGTNPTAYDRARSSAQAATFIGSGLVVIVVTLGGIAFAIAFADIRKLLIQSHGIMRPRLSVIVRTTLVVPLALLSAVGIAIVSATALSQSSAWIYWVIWVVPSVAGFFVSMVVGVLVFRSPSKM